MGLSAVAQAPMVFSATDLEDLDTVLLWKYWSQYFLVDKGICVGQITIGLFLPLDTIRCLLIYTTNPIA